MERLEQAGFACYIVGGAVRDWLAGGKPHDYDLCTAATPEQTERIFSDLHVIETGLKHGTVTIVMDGVRGADCATRLAEKRIWHGNTFAVSAMRRRGFKRMPCAFCGHFDLHRPEDMK